MDLVESALNRLMRARALRSRRNVVYLWTADWARAAALGAVMETEAWWFRHTKCQVPLEEPKATGYAICGRWRWHSGPHG